MENRFKFRLWNKKDNKFINSDDITLNQDGILIKTFNFDSELMIKGVTDDYIIIQSTGLSDKNGKLIFEGDILDNKDCSDSKVKVVFLFPSNENGYRYGFYLENLDTHSIREFFVPDIDLNKLEIIGNIYEVDK